MLDSFSEEEHVLRPVTPVKWVKSSRLGDKCFSCAPSLMVGDEGEGNGERSNPDFNSLEVEYDGVILSSLTSKACC